MSCSKIYLNNAAAYVPDGDLLTFFAQRAAEIYQNQESISSDTKGVLSGAAQSILESLLPRYAQKYRVLFLHTGTESVFAGLTLATKVAGGVCAVSRGEHASVRAFFDRLAETEKAEIPLLSDGRVDLTALEGILSPRVKLVAMHFVQSETGVVQDLAAVRGLMRRKCPGALLFVDAIQGIGKVDFPFDAVQPDFLTVSGQKLGIPAGAALIYRSDFRPDAQALRFAEHRIGRVSPVFAEMLAEAVRRRMGQLEQNLAKVKKLRGRALEYAESEDFAKVLHPVVPDGVLCSPYILSFLAYDSKVVYQGAILARSLEKYGIYISSGSACDAETPEPSATLTAMGIERKRAYGLLRISFSECNTESEIDRLFELLREGIRGY